MNAKWIEPEPYGPRRVIYNPVYSAYDDPYAIDLYSR